MPVGPAFAMLMLTTSPRTHVIGSWLTTTR
jgi:hypothetical protein